MTSRVVLAAFNVYRTDLVDYLKAVVQNNPTQSVDELLNRADVTYAVRASAFIAISAVKDLVTNASPLGDDYTTSIVADLDVIGNDLVSGTLLRLGASLTPIQLQESPLHEGTNNAYLQFGKDRAAVVEGSLDASLRSIVYRCVLAVRAAEAHTVLQESLQSMEDDNVFYKKWLATFIDNIPCSYCASLHGVIVKLHDQFPVPAGLKVYHSLEGPPAHPHCKCRIVPSEFSQRQALTETSTSPTIGGRVEDYHPPMVKASEVRAMEPSKLAALLAALGAIVARFRRLRARSTRTKR